MSIWCSWETARLFTFTCEIGVLDRVQSTSATTTTDAKCFLGHVIVMGGPEDYPVMFLPPWCLLSRYSCTLISLGEPVCPYFCAGSDDEVFHNGLNVSFVEAQRPLRVSSCRVDL